MTHRPADNLRSGQEPAHPGQPEQPPAAVTHVKCPSGRRHQRPARQQIKRRGDPGPPPADGPHLDSDTSYRYRDKQGTDADAHTLSRSRHPTICPTRVGLLGRIHGHHVGLSTPAAR